MANSYSDFSYDSCKFGIAETRSRYHPYRMQGTHCMYGTSGNSTEMMLKDQFMSSIGQGYTDTFQYPSSFPSFAAPYQGLQLTATDEQISTIRRLQDVCSTSMHSYSTSGVNKTTALDAYLTHRQEAEHPFYLRRRISPVEGMTRTRDKYRVVYTEKQRQGLERAYEETKFISAEKKQQLSKDLDLSERQVYR